MQRIADLERVQPAASLPRRRRGVWQWLWEPRPVTLRFRPALLAALLVLAAIPAARLLSRGSATPHVLVQFRLDAPDASRVQLAGDFTDWQPAYTLHETKAGVWSLVVPVAAGVHDYAFIIDGQRWIPDPLAPPIDDGFGGTNSRLTVLAPEERAAL
jgi:hypothetical protein